MSKFVPQESGGDEARVQEVGTTTKIPVIRVVSMGRRNTGSKSKLQASQR